MPVEPRSRALEADVAPGVAAGRRFGVRHPSLSGQRGELRTADGVATRREHSAVCESLTDPRLRALLDAVEGILVTNCRPRRLPARAPDVPARALGQAAMFGQIGDEP
ncbi:hypothetical protein R1A27_29910 (plasmid) [Methylobacterium sp. NMS12]|uniref:hypothetical protein n=1 Tax=Methylobacterium sp. NMS12 TaxID=3079766 RepID=UPI003F885934